MDKYNAIPSPSVFDGEVQRMKNWQYWGFIVLGISIWSVLTVIALNTGQIATELSK